MNKEENEIIDEYSTILKVIEETTEDVVQGITEFVNDNEECEASDYDIEDSIRESDLIYKLANIIKKKVKRNLEKKGYIW